MKKKTIADITEEDIKKAILEKEATNDSFIEIDGMIFMVIDGDFSEYAKTQGATPYKETQISKM